MEKGAAMISCSLIIPTYKRKKYVFNLLESLCLLNTPFHEFEVIVVENNYKDGTEQICDMVWPFHIKYVYIDNGIQAHARNKGIEHARGEYIVFLDSDVTVHAELVNEHISTLNKHDKCISIGNVKFPENMFIHPQAQLYDVARYCRHFSRYQKSGTFSFIQCLSCNLAVRRAQIIELNGFNEQFTVYGYEDLEFGYKAEKNGYHLTFTENAHVFHYHIRSIHEFCERAYEMGASAVKLKMIHPEIEKFIDLGILRTVHSLSVKKLISTVDVDAIVEKLKKYQQHYIKRCTEHAASCADIIYKKRLFHQIRKRYKLLYFYNKTRGIIDEIKCFEQDCV